MTIAEKQINVIRTKLRTIVFMAVATALLLAEIFGGSVAKEAVIVLVATIMLEIAIDSVLFLKKKKENSPHSS